MSILHVSLQNLVIMIEIDIGKTYVLLNLCTSQFLFVFESFPDLDFVSKFYKTQSHHETSSNSNSIKSFKCACNVT
jgi:hypothetical protein